MLPAKVEVTHFYGTLQYLAYLYFYGEETKDHMI